ncbi:MAG: hypothetical protein JO219_01085 [Candidatus Eremiobacteraeota bacterium]|nr:hypothetical protein [Candidatus Eremiobacteraeota bacterium]MBV8365684.1 hypothetical protein [Candidatus Eremiobacteraeota bacterium]
MSSGASVARLTAALALAGLLVAALSPTSAAPTAAASYASAAATDVGAVIERVVDRNPGLHSYRASAHLDLRQVTFPYLHPVLDGHAYVLAPGYTTFDYPHTPFYLKGLTKFQGAFGDATRWQRCYDITLSTRPDLFDLHMVPKVQGEIAFVDVELAPDGAINHVEWRYRENEKDYISLTQTYSSVQGHSVVTSQATDVTLHHIRAKGTQTFSAFEFNVPVPTPSPTPSDPSHACDN